MQNLAMIVGVERNTRTKYGLPTVDLSRVVEESVSTALKPPGRL